VRVAVGFIRWSTIDDCEYHFYTVLALLDHISPIAELTSGYHRIAEIPCSLVIRTVTESNLLIEWAN